jgi:hypothetical protein
VLGVLVPKDLQGYVLPEAFVERCGGAEKDD